MRLKIQCIYEPRGDCGLEGYQLGEFYYAYEKGKHYAIYDGGEYMNTTTKNRLLRYFAKVEEKAR